jgi:hypothetical protein
MNGMWASGEGLDQVGREISVYLKKTPFQGTPRPHLTLLPLKANRQVDIDLRASDRLYEKLCHHQYP